MLHKFEFNFDPQNLEGMDGECELSVLSDSSSTKKSNDSLPNLGIQGGPLQDIEEEKERESQSDSSLNTSKDLSANPSPETDVKVLKKLKTKIIYKEQLMNEIEQAKQTSKNVKEQELEAKQALKHLKNKLSMSLKDIPVKPITPI